ncbi:type VI secretion system protein TssA [Massilia atriviolacea]|uniref:Type VI secretion system protein TssA n=1 Tax=Massilia atriviolacea TaxID=2495579 RepID=A0A430HSI4_9BURK|nr:type VI secretion system protein TssA [Massilia atriviolacea]RSZ60513.1 type VI secretion system protein TssA [Massilia atriviolacea]
MNAIPDFLASAADQQVLDALLAPLADEAPCGPVARHDPVFTDIRLLREEDDPSLPMGQWERPLKRADWSRIEALCTTTLGTRSKDLQIAVWLLEAWTRQHGYVGLFHGVRLLDTLVRSYWPALHPLIEDDGDCDARLAPLEWLNASLSATLRVHAALLVQDGDTRAPVTLADWERMTAQDMAAPEDAGKAGKQNGDAAPPARADVIADARRMPAAVAVTDAAVFHSLDYLHALVAFLDERLGPQAPRLATLRGVLEAAQRVLLQFQPEQEDGPMEYEQAVAQASVPAPQAAAPASTPAPVAGANWRNRAEAYATLEALADYLSVLEPHSPTPFLLRRALNWGRMPLPEVIAEILREEGDLNRLVNVLGIKL